MSYVGHLRKGTTMIKRSFPSTRFLLSISLFGALVVLSTATPRTAEAATLLVDDDGQATATDCNAPGVAFNTIQGAVNAAVSGDTIQICPGTYNEQVVVTTSHLTIRGAGAGVTVVRPTAVAHNATNSFGNPVAAILLVNGAADVKVASLTIDGSAADSGASVAPPCPLLPFYTGIFFRNSSGTVDTARVTGIQSGTACAFAIRAETGELIVKTSLMDNYGTTGIACAFADTRCTLTDNAIRGRGAVDDELQVGIQIRSGAAGKISGNVITDHAFIGAHGVPQSAVGIFLVFATPSSNPHIVRDNVFANNQVNVQRIATAAAF
jgi:hypothetical protein